MKKLFVISLGGSLINPGVVDVDFLKKFRQLIINQTKKGHRFILITGGGKLSRNFQVVLNSLAKVSENDLYWIGIATTRLHAELIRLMFGKLANSAIVTDPNKKNLFKEKILLSGGWTPGRSTDDVAVRLAKTYGSQTVINLSNIDYLYNKDPRKYGDAKKIESISWIEFRKIIGDKWNPEASAPFDPVAAKNAKSQKIKVIIANGKNLENLKNILDEKKFIGTVIR